MYRKVKIKKQLNNKLFLKTFAEIYFAIFKKNYFNFFKLKLIFYNKYLNSLILIYKNTINIT